MDYTKDIIGFTNFICRATEEAFTTDGELVPVAHILKKGENEKTMYSIFPVQEFMENVNGKQILNSILHKIGKEENTLSAIFASEVWMSLIDKNKEL